MVFSLNPVESEWKWGKHALPRVSNYTYLGINFACNVAWDVHIRKVCNNCKKKVNQLHTTGVDCTASSAAVCCYT